MDIFEFHAGNAPHRLALTDGAAQLTWSELAPLVTRCAGGLTDLGVEPGDHVAIFASNSVEYVIATSSIRAAGAVSVPINSHLAPAEVAYILSDCGAKVLFVDRAHRPVADDALSTTSVEHVVMLDADAGGLTLDRLARSETRPSRAGTEAFGSYILSDCGAKVLFVDRAHRPVADDALSTTSVEHVVMLDADAGGPTLDRLARSETRPSRAGTEAFGSYILYTSGTTGTPKGAVHGQGPGAEVGAAYADAFGLRWEDVHLVAGPLYHSAPQAFCAITLTTGGSVVVMDRFDAMRAAKLIASESVTTTFMAPILLRRLCDALEATDEASRPDLKTLRAVIVAGAHCPYALKVRAHRLLGPVLYEFYGSTETKAALVIGPEDQLRKPGSCGRPFPGVEVKLVDEHGNEPSVGEPGVIWVRRNPATFDHYHQDPEKTRAAVRGEWIVTGDIAYRDDDGFFYLCDRVTDVVISGGVNIYPAEIEKALMEHDAVKDAAVVGVADDEWGEKLHAMVVAEGAVSPGDLETFLRERIAGFKVPRSWEMVEQLPRTDDGKLRKRLLKRPSPPSG